MTDQSANADALHAHGIALFTQGARAEAIGMLEQAASLRPADATILYNLGCMYQDAGDLGAATWAFRAAIAAVPAHAYAHNNLGVTYERLGLRAEAIGAILRAIAADPEQFDTVERHVLLSKLLIEERRFDEAVDHARKALTDDPTSLLAEINLGAAYNELGRYAEAAAVCTGTLARVPDDATTLTNLGVAYHALQRFDEAIQACLRALATQPGNVEAGVTLSSIYETLGDTSTAIDVARRTAALAPANAMAHAFLGALLLTHGDLRGGWREYEWLWRPEADRKYARFGAKPQWDGRPFPNRRLLLSNEQGLGDAIQMLRFIPRVKSLGGSVLFECPDELTDLVRENCAIDELLRKRDAIDPARFDLHVSMFSLPRVFDLDLAGVPAPERYLRANPRLVEQWSQRLGEKHGLRIGIVWAGDPGHRRDRDRSVDLAQFGALATVRGVEWFALQKGPRENDAPPPGIDLQRLSPELRTLADTAAAIEALDLVLSVDTSVVHLAGALGKPVWTLLPLRADWRWLIGRDDTPWYPSMRLFRQPAQGGWASVFARVRDELFLNWAG